ncbi:MAG TPA: histidine--tRNA ligase [Caulobacteraceae bacterium]|nr:histidine--tRNA ligase [Caulobacteraceae bacterium]
MAEDAALRPAARAPRGFADRRGAPLIVERAIIAAVVGVFERFGFEALETGALEYADALGKFLPDDDRPSEGVFSLRDDDEQWLALRYDLTAPLARYVAENREALPRPFRRYAFGPVWRDEKPGPGHGRQFIQCDADTVGSGRPEADAEIIAMSLEAYAAAGLARDAVSVKINSRKLLNGLLGAAGIGDERQRLAALRAVDKLDRLGPVAVAELLGPGRKDASGAFTRGAQLPTAAIEAVLAFVEAGRPSRAGTLAAVAEVIGGSAEGEAGLAELARIDAALHALGATEAAAAFDPSIVRGLEYYTGAVFEAQLTGKGLADAEEARRFGSIGGGGRYDDLVARFTGETTPATGFSFGVSRLADALAAGGATLAQEGRGPVVVVSLDESRMADYFGLARELREAGIAAEVYLGGAGMRAQMKYADRRLSPAAVILGDDEIACGRVTIKDLDLGAEMAADVADNRAWRADRPGQISVPRADFVEAVRRIVARAR